MPLPHKYWVIPLLVYLAIIPFTPFLDLTISRWFYQDGFIYGDNIFFTLLYRYGEFPALITGGLALLLFLASFLFKNLQPWRSISLFVVVTLVVGAAVITNGVLKDNWGRPRPKDVVEFGGTLPFHTMFQPQFGKHQYKSFCCGHCTMGFFFFSLLLAGWRLSNRYLALLGIFLSLFLGISLSLTRIAQGGHFFSDTITSALVMWLTAILINWLIPLQSTNNKGASCRS